MSITAELTKNVADILYSLYQQKVELEKIVIQKTRVEFEGQYSLVVFPFLKFSKKSPEETANDIGKQLIDMNYIQSFNVIKGFLNISLNPTFWVDFVKNTHKNKLFGIKQCHDDSEKITIEFSSPNTNKPLHLGHIRNNLLGHSIAEILKANGHNVTCVNLVNDRGIHICKSMLAWQKWGNNETPESTGKKGDKLVGDYYVKFDQEYKKEVEELRIKGLTEEEAKVNAPLLKEAQEMLRKWEDGDKEVLDLWNKMNGWVYKGFDETYNKLGISFDKIYYESETYKLGKSIVLKGLEEGVLLKKEDNSVWADLTQDGLDEKILLRSDGTTVYMTQDLGTAIERQKDLHFDKHLYVVGNEQNYHFQVLKIILKKLGYNWSHKLEHISYGMVELPGGKMKSREGTVVDADDLAEHMIVTAKQKTNELGKLSNIKDEDFKKIVEAIAFGALKYFILKVDPKKNMLFNPEESIDFNGNTGPFVQYTYARIKSLLEKAKIINLKPVIQSITLDKKEVDLVQKLYEFPEVIVEAGKLYSPAIIANYVYDLAKTFNQFYHELPILKAEMEEIISFRLMVTELSGIIIKQSLWLLGIEAPNQM